MSIAKEKPTVVCLTPVKNEAWILDRFLRCASLWADHIIVADQNSDDGSPEIAAAFPKVILIDNEEFEDYDEYRMRKTLFEAAGGLPGPKVLIALDADEVFTPNILVGSSWQAALDARPGTSLVCGLANLRPDMAYYWTQKVPVVFGFVDDGSEFTCGRIHTTRIHSHDSMPKLLIDEVNVMHYQYTDWERMESKHRWYKCWERVNNPKRSATGIYRQYHHMDTVRWKDLKPIPEWWFDDYAAMGIDMTSVRRDESYRWEAKVLEYLDLHGTHFFSDVDIWDVDWEQIARQRRHESPARFQDPRSPTERALHKWLEATQPYAFNPLMRVLDSLLGAVF